MIEFIEVELHVTFNLTFHTNKIHVSNGLIYISFSLHLQLGLQHIHLENDNTQLNARKINTYLLGIFKQYIFSS